MDEALRPLDTLDDAALAGLGGKTRGLVRLARAGLPVLPGFVVPAALLERLGDERGSEAGWAAASADWETAARALGPRLAVRSSAAGEDGGQRSYAGLHRTELGVRPEQVGAAVARVWRSRGGEAARSYGGEAVARAGMSVVVQPLVEAASAGVLFTVHPTSGSWGELVVEAVWGLGEPLVSGQVAPHWFLLRRPRRLPWGAGPLGRLRLRVVDRSTPALARWTRWRDGEVRSEPLPAHLAGQPVLDDEAVRALAALALRAERALGEPLDLEWARREDGSFVLLQARPITAVAAPERAQEVWTRRFIGERWGEPATPMGWSLVEPVLASLIAYPETQRRWLGGGPPLRLVEGWPYVNATVFRHLAFKLPGAAPPSFLLELLPPAEERRWRSRAAVAPDLRVYASILAETARERRWRRFAWNPVENPAQWRALVRRSAPLLAERAEGVAEHRARVAALRALLQEYVGVHVCSLLFANLGYELLSAGLAALVPQRASELLVALAVSPPGNRTLQANEALRRLALVLDDRALEALASGGALDPASQAALSGFLDRHGHRAVASWEVFSPRWRDQPALLVPLLRAVRSAEGDGGAAASEPRYHQALTELARAVGGGSGAALLAVVYLLRRYLLLRENQRDWFERLMDELRGSLRALGEALVARGALASADDVAWLRVEELEAALDGEPGAWRASVAARRQAHERARVVVPPAFLDAEAERLPVGPRLQGSGVSRGLARGVVRRLDRPADGARLGPGEVLVTHALDPSWTPLLRQAGAVVTELGGALSHGAVVAREYGVPMVANVEGATRQLRDGDEVTVDGTRGVVWAPGMAALSEP